MAYVAPTWKNGGPPAINAAALQAISDALARVDADLTAHINSMKIIAMRNVNITFTNGIGTYENSEITTASVTFVQWRAGAVATLQDSVLSTTANNGSLTIVAKNALTGGPLPLNILIINK